ncbi:MAG TPA: XkdF-like putative serine protease domain-containing protein [Armatimonadota bacterium]|jgi:hypothetical protein
MDDFEVSAPIVKRDGRRHVVMGEVLVPGLVDAHGDHVSAETVEAAAHRFMVEARTVGEMHRDFDRIGAVVESFIARPGDPDFTPGAWVLGVRCTPEVWRRVESGELRGFSIGGMARRLDPPEEGGQSG